jgi:ATP-dependent exoDNAse (exonuclease V) beta subunit
MRIVSTATRNWKARKWPMIKTQAAAPPADQRQRELALDPVRSILVQAPAGSGKTDLLTRRFLRLLGEVDDPGEVAAITFTIAAAAEMRQRILNELEKAAAGEAVAAALDEFSMDSLARRALLRSRTLAWNLLELPSQLRISTIDAFCRELALQQPLLSGLGGGLDIAAQPEELYRRAARRSLEQVDGLNAELGLAIEELLMWRDNGWAEMEDLLVVMLGERDRWMHGFVLEREPDWEALRERLERPFASAGREAITVLSRLFSQVPGAAEEALELARFACGQSGGQLHRDLAELAEFPRGPFNASANVEDARQAYLCLGNFLLTGDGAFRKAVDKRLGFPADRKLEKSRLVALIARLAAIPGLESALAAARNLPPARYTEDDWQIVRACFTLLRHAAAELQVVFAEAGAVDYVEVAQIAQRVLAGEDGLPTDAGLAVSGNIRHLLVDEFQDTSRRQHQLLARLVAAWPEREGRTCFAVGDPMQSIYFFRDADAELFPRVREAGLEVPGAEPLVFDFVPLTANFRTAPALVERLNEVFGPVFAAGGSGGVSFSPALPAREASQNAGQTFNLNIMFTPQTSRGTQVNSESAREREKALTTQTDEIVALIHSRLEAVENARAHGAKYRIAVLGRTRKILAVVAAALREARIPFRAIELEQLADRPEVLDALALARALLNPQDRVAWMGVLRAPWCGLALDDLHRLASADDPEVLRQTIPELLAERLTLLSDFGASSARRVFAVVAAAQGLRSKHPAAALGTWLEQVWLRLGGAECVDAAARANLDLLWSCIDRLPDGETGLPGPTLDAALKKLTALPDPAVSGDFGVQLMTIHKAKGLEFEVVIVPDLHAGEGRSHGRLLSWLERGLPASDNSGDGEITEFLVAPIQRKREERGTAKAFVDHVRRERESQETRRILYVAATRAREELHLFARPAYKVDTNTDLSLCEPTNSLLATAWSALGDEIRARFEQWKASRTDAAAVEGQVLESIAAAGQSNLVVMPSPAKPTILRRLPPDCQPGAPGLASETWEASAEKPRAPSFRLFSGERVGDLEPQSAATSTLYARHEGGPLSRALGNAVHRLLEELARLRLNQDWEPTRDALRGFVPRIAADARAVGIDPHRASQIAAEALDHALNASRDPIGQWILSPHAEAASEVNWAGVVSSTLRTVRVDRVFRAGLLPQAEGEDAWWIIDYKTAHAEGLDPDAELPRFRELFAPQLEAYGEILRNLHGTDAPLRAGLYYPRMLRFDWWEL